MDNATREGTGNVRSHFRTREGTGEECLPCRQCEGCGKEQYQTYAGSWQHWATLEEACESVPGLERPLDSQEGGML